MGKITSRQIFADPTIYTVEEMERGFEEQMARDIYILPDPTPDEFMTLSNIVVKAKGGVSRIYAQAKESMKAAHEAKVTDQATLDKAALLLGEVKRMQKDFDAARKEAVEPLNAVVKEINESAYTVYHPLKKLGLLGEAETALKEKIGAYMEATEAKTKGVHEARRFTYKLKDETLLKFEYLQPNAKAIQAVVTAMGKMAEKAVSRLKTRYAIEVQEETSVRARAGG